VKTIFNWRERFRENPEGTGLVIGGLIGAAVALSVAIISLLLNRADVLASPGGGEAHYGLLIGFVILPLTFLAGAPWSIIALGLGHGKAVSAIVGGVLGLIINGSACGWYVGLRAKTRLGSKDTN
jgi:hypothetical protein